jgi:hypothetical protein
MADKKPPEGLSQLKTMVSRWEDHDGEFRQFTARRSDTLKMIAAGNTSGLLAVAVFLTAGTRTGPLLAEAKWAFGLFFVGVAAFFVSYRGLYRFEGDIEDALVLVRSNVGINNAGVEKILVTALKRSKRAPYGILISLICLIAGAIICAMGLLSL